MVPITLFPREIWVEINEESERAALKHPNSATILGTAPNGTSAAQKHLCEVAQRHCEERERAGKLTFADVFFEEATEVLCEEDDARLRAELIQVAQVTVRWIANIDRRKAERDAQGKEDREAERAQGDENGPTTSTGFRGEEEEQCFDSGCRNAEEPEHADE